MVYTSAFGAAADHPVDFFRTKHQVELALAESGLDAVVLRPTAFMEHHAHNFIGKGLLDKDKASLIGRGTKPRNFICAEDVAIFAVRALLDDSPPRRMVEIGGPGHYSNLDVANLYATTAGIPLRVSHLPTGIAAVMSVLARPVHPGLARVMRLLSMPDDAFDEHFHGADALQREHGVKLTTLEAFVQRQVEQTRRSAPAR